MEHVLGMRQKAAVFGALFFGGFALGGLALVVVCESWPRFSFALLTAFLGWCAVRLPLCMVGVEGTSVVVRNTLRTHRIQRAEVVAVETLGYKPPRPEVHRVRKFSPAFALLVPVAAVGGLCRVRRPRPRSAHRPLRTHPAPALLRQRGGGHVGVRARRGRSSPASSSRTHSGSLIGEWTQNDL